MTKRKTEEADAGLSEIELRTHNNGYGLRVGKESYFYYNRQELIEGFLYHVGLGEVGSVDKSFITAIVSAAAEWKKGGDFVKSQADKVISLESRLYEKKRELKLAQVETKNLKKMLSMRGVII